MLSSLLFFEGYCYLGMMCHCHRGEALELTELLKGEQKQYDAHYLVCHAPSTVRKTDCLFSLLEHILLPSVKLPKFCDLCNGAKC